MFALITCNLYVNVYAHSDWCELFKFEETTNFDIFRPVFQLQYDRVALEH